MWNVACRDDHIVVDPNVLNARIPFRDANASEFGI